MAARLVYRRAITAAALKGGEEPATSGRRRDCRQGGALSESAHVEDLAQRASVDLRNARRAVPADHAYRRSPKGGPFRTHCKTVPLVRGYSRIHPAVCVRYLQTFLVALAKRLFIQEVYKISASFDGNEARRQKAVHATSPV